MSLSFKIKCWFACMDIWYQHGRRPRPWKDLYARLAAVEDWGNATWVHTEEVSSPGPQGPVGTVSTDTSDRNGSCNGFSFHFVLLNLLAATRLGDTLVALPVLWPCLTFCWEDSSGGLQPLLLLWLSSTPCSHQRREATNDRWCTSSSVISFGNILCFLFNKCFDHPCTSLVIIPLEKQQLFLKMLMIYLLQWLNPGLQ